MHSSLLPVHIAAGGIAMILGAIALIVRKGGTIHRRSGLLFVYAILLMCGSALILESLRTPNWTNVFAALMTTYFVVTALTTVRPASPWTHRVDIAALTIAVGLALIDFVTGVKAFNSPRGLLNGVPFPMFFVFATLMTTGAIGDARVMRSGMPRGGPRLARHLWRMCFALFIAAGSFFSIRSRVARILPEPFTTGPMRTLPILLVFGAMFYWLWRVRRRRPLPVILRHEALPQSAPASAPTPMRP